MFRSVGVAAFGIVALVFLVGCSPAVGDGVQPGVSPELTTVPAQPVFPTPAPTPVQLARPSSTYPVYATVFDAGAWRSVSGCGCVVDGGDAELYPAGTPVWGLRVNIYAPTSYGPIPFWDHVEFDDGIFLSDVLVSWVWDEVPVELVPVAFADEGRELAVRLGLPFGFDELDREELLLWGEEQEFLVAVYVPEGVADLRFGVNGPNPTETPNLKFNDPRFSYGLRIPITSDAATLVNTLP